MKLGILTGGGDCPGLNAVIRAVARTSMVRGHDVLGVRAGAEDPRDMRVQRPLVRPRERIECTSVTTSCAIEVIHHAICDILPRHVGRCVLQETRRRGRRGR
jgi:hypothetical protein